MGTPVRRCGLATDARHTAELLCNEGSIVAPNKKGVILAGSRFMLRLTKDMSLSKASASKQLMERILRYDWLMHQVPVSSFLSAPEQKMARASLEKWITSPVELIGYTAAATAKHSGQANEEFVRKLDGLRPVELLILAHWLDEERDK